MIRPSFNVGPEHGFHPRVSGSKDRAFALAHTRKPLLAHIKGRIDPQVDIQSIISELIRNEFKREELGAWIEFNVLWIQTAVLLARQCTAV